MRPKAHCPLGINRKLNSPRSYRPKLRSGRIMLIVSFPTMTFSSLIYRWSSAGEENSLSAIVESGISTGPTYRFGCAAPAETMPSSRAAMNIVNLDIRGSDIECDSELNREKVYAEIGRLAVAFGLINLVAYRMGVGIIES